MPYCPDCGAETQVGAAHCQSCGQSLESADAGAAESPSDVAGGQPVRDASGYTTGQKALFVGAAVAAIGAFLPWMTVEILGSSATKSGIEGDGVITLVLALVAAGVAFVRWGRIAKVATGVIGAIVLLFGFAYISDPLLGAEVADAQTRQIAEQAISPGIGLYMTAAAGLAILAGPVIDSVN